MPVYSETSPIANDPIVVWLLDHGDEVETLTTPDLLAKLEATFPTATIKDFQSSLRTAASMREKHAAELRRYAGGHRHG